MKNLKTITVGTVAGVFLALGTAVAGSDNSFGWHANPALVGTWQFEMTVRVDAPDCANSPPIPFGPNPFTALISFHEGGTLNEYASRTPPGVRTTGFGSWKQTGKNKYKARYTFMEFDANGLLWRTMVIEKNIDLKRGGDSYDAISRLELTDISGNVTKICATVAGERFKA